MADKLDELYGAEKCPKAKAKLVCPEFVLDVSILISLSALCVVFLGVMLITLGGWCKQRRLRRMAVVKAQMLEEAMKSGNANVAYPKSSASSAADAPGLIANPSRSVKLDDVVQDEGGRDQPLLEEMCFEGTRDGQWRIFHSNVNRNDLPEYDHVEIFIEAVSAWSST